LLFLLLTGVEVLIALFVHDDFVRPYVGDALVVIVIYCFVRIFFPDGIRLLPLYIFLFSVAVELMQLFGVMQILSGGNRFLTVLLGSAFSIWDIVCYAAGCVVLVGIERWGRRVRNTQD